MNPTNNQTNALVPTNNNNSNNSNNNNSNNSNNNNNNSVARIPKRITATTSSNGSACAACRYQRRRCTKDCPLAPYFPADKQKQFLNVHKLYGVHNVVKTLQSVPPKLRPDAAKSLIFSADARARDPVGGCYRIIQLLRAQIASSQAQLNHALASLAAAKASYDPDPGGGFGFGYGYGCGSSSGHGIDLEMDMDMFGGDVKPFRGSQVPTSLMPSVQHSEPRLSDEDTKPVPNSKGKAAAYSTLRNL